MSNDTQNNVAPLEKWVEQLLEAKIEKELIHSFKFSSERYKNHVGGEPEGNEVYSGSALRAIVKEAIECFKNARKEGGLVASVEAEMTVTFYHGIPRRMDEKYAPALIIGFESGGLKVVELAEHNIGEEKWRERNGF